MQTVLSLQDLEAQITHTKLNTPGEANKGYEKYAFEKQRILRGAVLAEIALVASENATSSSEDPTAPSSNERSPRHRRHFNGV
jgi:hypothetical protein